MTDLEQRTPFCPRDGRAMLVEVEQRGFDVRTGARLTGTVAHCPRRWHRWLDGSWDLVAHRGTDGTTVYEWTNIGD